MILLSSEISIRPIRETEYSLLERFLFESLHVPPGYETFDWDTIYQPEINVYIKDFGKPDDVCFVAELKGQVVGAAYSRILAGPGIVGFGNIDFETPELAISVLPDFRGLGVGTMLLNTLHAELTIRKYKRISLSVQKTNPATHLYERLGYVTVDVQDSDFIMVKELQD